MQIIQKRINYLTVYVLMSEIQFRMRFNIQCLQNGDLMHGMFFLLSKLFSINNSIGLLTRFYLEEKVFVLVTFFQLVQRFQKQANLEKKSKHHPIIMGQFVDLKLNKKIVLYDFIQYFQLENFHLKRDFQIWIISFFCIKIAKSFLLFIILLTITFLTLFVMENIYSNDFTTFKLLT